MKLSRQGTHHLRMTEDLTIMCFILRLDTRLRFLLGHYRSVVDALEHDSV